MKLTIDSAKIFSEDGEAAKTELASFIDQIAFIINGNLDLIQNLKMETLNVSFPSAGSEQDVRHRLGRVPVGYLVISRSAAISVYDGSNDWNQNSLFVRSSAPGRARLLVF